MSAEPSDWDATEMHPSVPEPRRGPQIVMRAIDAFGLSLPSNMANATGQYFLVMGSEDWWSAGKNYLQHTFQEHTSRLRLESRACTMKVRTVFLETKGQATGSSGNLSSITPKTTCRQEHVGQCSEPCLRSSRKSRTSRLCAWERILSNNLRT